MQTQRRLFYSHKSYLDRPVSIITITDTISGNIATGFGINWETALRNSIEHFKNQYGDYKNPAILIDE